jgi:peptidoglycan/xylan/chitin deacetylase (PgdA/CDA1 family)
MKSSAAARLAAPLLVLALAAASSAGAQGILSFVFDDGYDTDLSLALGIFEEEGCVASSAIVTDAIGSQGRLDADGIRALAAAGWEIMSHTASHPNLRSLSEAGLEAEFERSLAALESLGLRPRNLVYPCNKSNPLVREVASRYFRSARGGGKLFDGPGSSLYDLGSFEIKDNLADALREIDEAAASGSWLILYHHRIMEKLHIEGLRGHFRRDETVSFSPSGAKGRFEPSLWNRLGRSLYIVPLSGEAAPGDVAVGEESGARARVSGVGCDERELLRSLLRYAKERHPGMTVSTVDQALDELAPTRRADAATLRE